MQVYHRLVCFLPSSADAQAVYPVGFCAVPAAHSGQIFADKADFLAVSADTENYFLSVTAAHSDQSFAVPADSVQVFAATAAGSGLSSVPAVDSVQIFAVIAAAADSAQVFAAAATVLPVHYSDLVWPPFVPDSGERFAAVLPMKFFAAPAAAVLLLLVLDFCFPDLHLDVLQP